MNGTNMYDSYSRTPPKMILRMRNLLLPAWMPLTFPSSCERTMIEESVFVAMLPPYFKQLLSTASQDPATLFHTLLVALVSITVSVRILQYQLQPKQPPTHRRRLSLSHCPTLQWLQWKFLVVFWLLRTSFWMSGPYFYAALASKTNHNTQLISQISLAGYAAIAIFSPLLGKWTDKYGRKLGTLVATFLYALGSLSVLSDNLTVLILGRALGGMGTSLLSAAPEAWLVSAYKDQVLDIPTFLQQTFGIAYAFDSVCAIAAGQLAGWAANRFGPTGPFQSSPVFLALGATLAGIFWKENRAAATVAELTPPLPKQEEEDFFASSEEEETSVPPSATIWDALRVIRDDPKIIFLGGVQSLFEGAMYIFVMQWPPTLLRAIQWTFGKKAITPYGTAFSCFMACCMAGSTLFGILSRRNKNRGSLLSVEKQTVVLLVVSTLALLAATAAVSSDQEFLWQLIVAYFVFEASVGMYFPSIGTLRSKYIPDSHRSRIMTLFAVPLNIIVVTVFLLVHKLGDVGALGVASTALGLATVCMVALCVTAKRQLDREEQERKSELRDRFKRMVRQATLLKHASEALQEQFYRDTIVRENRDRFFVGRQAWA